MAYGKYDPMVKKMIIESGKRIGQIKQLIQEI